MAWILQTLKPDRKERELIALMLGTCERTLRNWQAQLLEPGQPEGRPPHSRDDKRACARSVRRILRDEGYDLSEDAMLELLEKRKDPQPRRLVRWDLQGLKARHRKRRDRLAKEQRLQLEVLEEDVIWSLDATHLGYQSDGSKLEGQVIVDVKSHEARAASAGSSPKAEDAIRLLEHAKMSHGQLPLVLSVDNGYDSKALRNYLEEERVLLLVNLPYTPEHNCWVERAMRSLKEGLRERLPGSILRGTQTIGLNELLAAMRDSLQAMGERRRARRGIERSNDRDSASQRRYDRELRDSLARQAALKIKQIPVELCSARRRRLLERYAILETLLEAGLINLTRGGRPWDQVEWEELT